MRRSKLLAMFAVLAVGATTSAVVAQGVSSTNAEGERPACVDARGEVRMQAFGWNHVVVVHNRCSAPVTCRVASDVDPTPTTVRVEAGTTVETLTRRGSPASAFVGRASCEL